LAAGVAHDIRNPLSSLKLFVQMLRAADEEEQAMHQIMLREIERVEWTVKGLLDLVRPSDLQLAPGSVNDVVRETLRLTTPQLGHRKITIMEQFDSTLPLVLLDADRLKQAILNLILNAADAMPDGGVLYTATKTDVERTVIILEICDDGDGIPLEMRTRVFEPFFSTKRDGVGLGLMNAKSIVERHRGTLRLIPRERPGTCAVITLPLGNTAHLSSLPGREERC
jgi:signal transduction histidine kinase